MRRYSGILRRIVADTFFVGRPGGKVKGSGADEPWRESANMGSPSRIFPSMKA
jgi:hypothetical protein